MGQPYAELSKDELNREKKELEQKYISLKARGLKLNISRGVPAKEQLDLSQGIFTCLKTPEDYFCDGVDARTYGLADGLPCAKRLFAELLGVDENCVIVGNSSSLNMIYDMIARSMCFGIGGQAPWQKQGKVKFICVVPGMTGILRYASCLA